MYIMIKFIKTLDNPKYTLKKFFKVEIILEKKRFIGIIGMLGICCINTSVNKVLADIKKQIISRYEYYSPKDDLGAVCLRWKKILLLRVKKN